MSNTDYHFHVDPLSVTTVQGNVFNAVWVTFLNPEGDHRVVCKFSLNGREEQIDITIPRDELIYAKDDKQRVDAKIKVVEKVRDAICNKMGEILTKDYFYNSKENIINGIKIGG